MKKITKILALMLVLTMGVCMFTGCSAESEVQGVVEDFYEAALEANFAEAAELVGDEDLKEELEVEQKQIDKNPEAKEKYLDYYEGIKYEVKDVKVDGDEATVIVEVTFDGETYEDLWELEEIDGDWLIVGLDN